MRDRASRAGVRLAVVAVTVAMGLAVSASQAAAADIVPGNFTYYKIQTNTLLYPGTPGPDFGFGRGVVTGPDGNVWWADLSPDGGQYPTRLGRLTPTGVFRRPFNVGETIIEDMAHGPDGNVWYPERFSGGPRGGSIARVEASGRLTRFNVCPDRFCGFFDITAGADGNVWFDRTFRDDPNDPHRGNGSINRITPTGKITSFPVPPKADGSDAPVNNRFGGMTAGPDGNVWLSELSRHAIGRITPSGQYTEFPVPDDWGPTGIASYAGDLWIGDANQPVVRRLNTAGQLVAEYRFDLPDDGFPETTRGSLAAGPDGVYFDIPAQPIGVGRITAAGDMTLFDSGAAPGSISIVQIAKGPDDKIWFKAVKGGARHIGRLNPDA